ncbi:hypothetical protein A8C56_21485 [Niabella ginsenosidivorans]|uniref:Uncharacterized protein n=1 Tax=Niabella ginsenosidivorans TaxID=1176587 RepID=A0A1A9I690_9BACT|nr:hypothetical protein [Niabella ginsenosidivorans]ANH83207.1 hypothetical protein A8C56_21485 [Niabella ginsenosidivorans]
MTAKYPILKQLFYWLIAFSLLVFIYSTAYGSYNCRSTGDPDPAAGSYVLLGIARYYFRGKYMETFLLVLLIAILYRLTEVFIADPFLYLHHSGLSSI